MATRTDIERAFCRLRELRNEEGLELEVYSPAPGAPTNRLYYRVHLGNFCPLGSEYLLAGEMYPVPTACNALTLSDQNGAAVDE